MNMLVSSKHPENLLSAVQADNKIVADRYKTLKKDLVKRCGEERLQASWIRLVEAFEKEIPHINEKGPEIIPQIHFSTILENNLKFPSTFADEIRKRGCVVIRNVVDRNEALKYKEDVQQYLNNHKGDIGGYPDEDPQIWHIHWSKSQIAARSHKNFVAVSRALNNLWSARPGTPIDFDTNITYCDRVRIRQPGDITFALAEHIDGGSVERMLLSFFL